MSRNKYLIKRAGRTAARRKRVFGIDPPPAVTQLLEKKPSPLRFRQAFRLLVYVFFLSPRHRMEIFWRRLSDRDTPLKTRWIERLARELRSLLNEGSVVKTSFFERRNYSHDLARVPSFLETALFRTTPYLIVQPRNEEDIVKILDFCRERRIPLIPRGASSSAFGGTVPVRSGIVLDLSPMMAVTGIDPQNQTVKIQPGARWADVASKLESLGLALRTTPTSRFSTVAGWISTGGLGIGSYGFGNVFESVKSIRIVRPNDTIEELDAGSEFFRDLFGSEGQFGIMTEISLHVRPRTEYSSPLLFGFDSPDKAFDFLDTIEASGSEPSHVVFFDREYTKRENILFRKQNRKEESILPEKDTLLLHFESPEEEQKFISILNGQEDQIRSNSLAARYLWAERYFPLKIQRIGPSLLGSEVVIPKSGVPDYLARIRRLARRLRIRPTVEVIVCRENGSLSNLVIVSFACDSSRPLPYLFNLLFVQLLVKIAVKSGGYPYGIGIWNTSFIGHKYSPSQLQRLKSLKQKWDPDSILNPHKFFKIKGRFFGLPSLALHPLLFRPAIALARWTAPVLGLFLSLLRSRHSVPWDLPEPEEKQGKDFIKQCALRCTSCGSCLSVCPAYHITGDELVTGRAKLRMAETIINNAELTQQEAHRSFQCLHCGLCEEVCQTHLPLRDAYVVLEDWLEARFGSPDETVENFIDKLDANRDFIEDVFGLDLPEWSAEKRPAKVPQAQKRTEEETA